MISALHGFIAAMSSARRPLTRGILFLIFSLGGLVARGATETAEPYGHNPAAGHTAQVNGIALYYEVYGTGTPLVLLHGNGGSLADLHFQIAAFRPDHQVIAIDSRGHGRSEMGPGRLTYEQIADDAAALLAALHAGPADVFGWSDGGIVALLLALRHPSAVHRIALSGANLSPGALAPGDLTGMAQDLRDARAQLAAGDQSRPWATVCQQIDLMLTQPHITDAELARITAPALVLAGEHDLIPEPHTRAIAAGLPRATLRIFAGAGHAALQEKPEEFNAALRTFFAPAP